MMRWIRHAIVVGLLALAGTPAAAQDSLRAAAVVNDEVISQLDLRMRMRLVSLSSGLSGSPREMNRIAPQVLRNLIRERLQLQEARRLGIEVTEEEKQRAIAQIAQRNNMSADGFVDALERNGIMRETFLNQVRANIAWQKLIRQELRPQLNIGPEDVEDVVERRKAREGERLMRIHEIFLPAENGNAEQVRGTAQRLMQELRDGARFNSLARQFSQSATAASGGDLGWVTPASLPEPLAERVKDMREGQVTGPVEAFGGYYIVALEKVREIGDSDATVTLKQLLLPLDNGVAEDTARRRMADVAGRIDACGDVREVAGAAEGVQAIDVGELKMGDMPERIQDAVGALEVGQTSEVMTLGNGIGVIVLCGRDSAGIDREAIRENLMRGRLDMLARRYMRDLRRQAFVDIRMN